MTEISVTAGFIPASWPRWRNIFESGFDDAKRWFPAAARGVLQFSLFDGWSCLNPGWYSAPQRCVPHPACQARARPAARGASPRPLRDVRSSDRSSLHRGA